MDKDWKERVVRHLRVPSDGVETWSDSDIELGDDWHAEIDKAIARATVGVFLVSPHSLTSSFILHKEIPELLKKHAQQRLRFVPLLIHDAAYTTVSWLSPLQWFPRDRTPLAARPLGEADALLAELATIIHGLPAPRDSSADMFRVAVIDFAPRDRASAPLAIADLLRVDPLQARSALEQAPVVVGQSSDAAHVEQVLRRLRAAHIPATRYRLSNDHALEALRGPHNVPLMRVQERGSRPLCWMLHPVTRGLFGAVMDNDAGRKNPLHPMTPLRWSECEALCERLNRSPHARGRFRLPTPQEWLRAARGGDPQGLERSRWQLQAWMSTTAPMDVCMREPNGWGLFDMAGNVEEWTATSDGEKALCGGSYRSDAASFDLAMPRAVTSETDLATSGVRLVMEEP